MALDRVKFSSILSSINRYDPYFLGIHLLMEKERWIGNQYYIGIQQVYVSNNPNLIISYILVKIKIHM